jgi:hypothetical protein
MTPTEQDFFNIDRFLAQSTIVEPVITAQNLSSIDSPVDRIDFAHSNEHSRFSIGNI